MTDLKSEKPAKKAWIVAGGSYNPITKGHLIMLDSVKAACEARGYTVERGLFSPVPDAYCKYKKGILPAKQRADMVRLATEGTWCALHDWEWRQPRFIPTRELLDHIQAEAGPDVTIVFACGADLIHSMAYDRAWAPQDCHHLLSSFVFIVVERAQASGGVVSEVVANVDHMAPGRDTIIVIQPNVENDLSSTLARDSLASGGEVDGIIPDGVAEYIRANGLYRPEPPQ